MSVAVLTGRVRDFALNVLQADLVGIANIERFAKAPPMMSPQGIMPSARSVVVMAVHHPDAAIEMGGREHPQIMGPYGIQGLMNSRLDEMSYRMGLFLEREGFAAVPIAGSNIWRYKGYKDLKEQFAPDVSHIHSSVAAGLSELGYSGLAITPEFGARQRYVTVITDAVLQPSPLLAPGSVCDGCNLCVKHCMSGALSQEIDGLNVVEIEDKKYTFANKNLWRCAWGEHFGLDLDLPKPDRVDEAVILENIARHGLRGGEMGSCLRYCLPKAKRYFDRDYTNAPRRRRRQPDADAPDRTLQNGLLARAYGAGADFVGVIPAAELKESGVDAAVLLPDALSLIVIGVHSGQALEDEPQIWTAINYLLEKAAYDMARSLERLGYSALSMPGIAPEVIEGMVEGLLPGRAVKTAVVLTSALLEPIPLRLTKDDPPALSPSELKSALKRLLTDMGADLVGTAPAGRLAELQPQLAEIFEGREYLEAVNKSGLFSRYDPEISLEKIHVTTPGDHLTGARSVIVIGLRLPKAAVECTARPPAEAVGPYAFAQYASIRLLALMGYRLRRLLEDRGFNSAMTFDLCGTASFVNNPRGRQPDVFSNRFAAVAAGLGRIGKGGFVLTPEFGPNVRFLAIVTDADIPADDVLADGTVTEPCADCRICLDHCRTAAHGEAVEVAVDGQRQKFHVLDRNRCDWAKRYSLVGEEGVNYMGWNMQVPLPETIDADNLAEGLRQHPPIQKHLTCNFEACAVACPLARSR